MTFSQFNTQPNPFEVDICALLQTMSLGERRDREDGHDSRSSLKGVAHDGSDLSMVEGLNYHSDGESECSAPSTDGVLAVASHHYGCAYLQMLRTQIDDYPTTGGEYVEAIFTHREVFFAHPVAHWDCARGFSDIAGVLEKRGWRANRDADTEAVAAFRHEALVIANSLPQVQAQSTWHSHGSSSVCAMPPAY